MGTDPHSPSAFGYEFVAVPSSATVASAIARRRATPARREGWPGAIADQLRDHCHPARVYRLRVAQPAR